MTPLQSQETATVDANLMTLIDHLFLFFLLQEMEYFVLMSPAFHQILSIFSFIYHVFSCRFQDFFLSFHIVHITLMCL